MIPDEMIKQLYLTKEFMMIPCCFQALFFDALEYVLEKFNFKIVREEYAANDKS